MGRARGRGEKSDDIKKRTSGLETGEPGKRMCVEKGVGKLRRKLTKPGGYLEGRGFRSK